jgi:guanylate kinase
VSKPRISSDPGARDSRGRFLVLSGPSGSGKSTLARLAMARVPRLTRSITYTTRPPRAGEVDGQDYHFVAPEVFTDLARRDDFLEFATVHGNSYATARQDVDRLRAEGLDVLLVIDYQGAASLRQQRVDALYIFILPPSLAVLEQRLRQRHSDDDATLRTRLANAPTEMAQYRHYDYVIVNDDLETATQQLQGVIVADRCCVERLDRRYTIFAELDGWLHERGASA